MEIKYGPKPGADDEDQYDPNRLPTWVGYIMIIFFAALFFSILLINIKR